jgi:hypothetical protein
MVFIFYTEDGEFRLEYADYLKRPELMARIGDDSRILVNLGLRILSFDRRWLAEHANQRRFVEHMQHEREQNPLRFFLPHCANHADFVTPSHLFINDNANIYTAITCGNRYGKTTLLWVKMLLRWGLIQTDPNWEVFKEHGVRYQEYLGPREVALVSYLWDNHRETLWPKVVKMWTPKSILGDYINWNVPLKTQGETLRLGDGLSLTLKACAQPQAAFESGAFDGMGWDEQGVEAKFDGANARLKTRRKWYKDRDGIERISRGFHVSAMTPHKVEGRPDTGSGTWIHRMATGEETRGISSRFYSGDLIKDVPDWIYAERQKAIDLRELDEAEQRLDRKRVRQIRARLFGEWESSTGAVFDEYDEDVHVIDDIDIPSDWCAIRGWDHGRTNPTAAVSVAITPNQDYVIFRDYIGAGQVISANVQEVVRRAGNTLEQMPDLDLRTQIVRRWREQYLNEQYICDILDGHTFKTPDNATRLTVGELYRASGLSKVRAAIIGDESPGIMLIKELLRINPERVHIQSGRKGAPRLYVFRSCKHTRRAFLEYANKPQRDESGNPSERPQDKKNHLPDALRYAIEMRVPYMPECTFRPSTQGASNAKTKKPRGYTLPEDRRDPVRDAGVRRDRYTGYPF